ncbi:hypothetical protein KSS87_017571 [Heliosperma pusillum]|nr:hypothetical protein KSS87_017571 [Heliosperma pusillum]
MASFQWAHDPKPLSLTSQFIVPDENKPNLNNVSHLDTIPFIDMSKDRKTLIHDISRACEDYGFFQLTNHGIPVELCHNVLQVITEFFELPYEEKVTMLSNEHMEDGKLFKYYITDQVRDEKILMWGEAFFHTWDLLVGTSYTDDRLPLNPPNYREVVATYIREVAKLVTKLLGLISQALGLDENYFEKTFGEISDGSAQANYYPPCPDPTLTLGLRDHTDIKILTVLLADQGKPGLQVLNNHEWFKVDSKPGALIVNVADQLQVLSNDKFKSARHRIVNDEVSKRASFAIFVGPGEHGVVGPIKELLNDDYPALYRNYKFSEFMEEFRNQKGKRRAVKEHFLIKRGSEAGGASSN